MEYKNLDYFNKRYQLEYSSKITRRIQSSSLYKINRKEEIEFKNEWKIIDSLLPPFKEFPIWLMRFFESYERKRPENTLIDLIIVLETLLGDGGSEMTHKISTRTTILLTSDSKTDFESLIKSRIEMRKYFKNIY